jgi:hypothetical protein
MWTSVSPFAVGDSDIPEVVVTADVSLTAGHLSLPPGRVLHLRVGTDA